ncbi:hypothetical protein OAK38_01870 [Verrucomicrobia bacterium]|nr:hypothetical protein [Verrucomicrobiota bacterium]
MQPWQSVLLIILSLSLFYYGVYYEEIKEESLAPLADQPLVSMPVKEPSKPSRSPGVPELETQENLSSDSWAELRTLLLVENGGRRHTSLHSDALLSPFFLEKVMALISKSPTVKKMILSPFQSSAFKQNESQIMRALFSIRDAPNANGLFLVCRGHSIKTARLLAKAVAQTYKEAISRETMDDPLIAKFQKHLKKMADLDQKINLLVEKIQKSSRDGNSANVEEIALQAELDQTNKELSSMVKPLRQIESLSKSNPNPMALLEVEKIAKYKSLPELVRMSAQLETMLANDNPDSFVKKEVLRNLDSTKQNIDKEIKNAIAWIKSVAKETLDRKKGLERKLAELRAKEEDAVLSNPGYEKLKRLNAELSSLKENYREQFDDWKKAKENFRFEEIKVQELEF